MTNEEVIQLIVVLAVLLFSATLHEIMHGLTAFRLGDDTAEKLGRLSLNPFKHVDLFLTLILPVSLFLSGLPILAGAKPVPFNPHRVKGGDFGAALVGVMGPVTNLLIALLFAVAFRMLGSDVSELTRDIFELTIRINIGLFIFNLVPWPPLDGSRVLYAFAPEAVRSLMTSIERMGMIGFLIFFLLIFQLISPALGQMITSLSDLLLGT